MTSKQIRIYSILFIVGIGSWLAAYFFEVKQISEVVAVDHSPDYFSTDYTKKEMDQNGMLKSELYTAKMIHYGDDKTTELDHPVMTLYNSEAPPWIIKSQGGWLAADRNHLLLTGKVFISREETENNTLFKINTSELKVTLSTNFATTANWAELIDGSNRTEGIGLAAVFVEPLKIKFLSHVKGRYEFN
ncbi:MAG: LPS export ABC transporter periplasmic protein LptC [Methylococcales bacterium]|nr:LPS export ABC transporter periplasmic protein LptC [Methylococcales bacterium]